MGRITSGDNKRKHLEMIQVVINRMASNSFLFKGWSITIIAGISAFATKDTNTLLMTVPIVATILFWGVDAYYLMLERAFRNLYDDVAEKDESNVDFKMRVNNIGLRIWLRTALTRPILLVFYFTVLVTLIVLTLALNGVKIEVNFNHGAYSIFLNPRSLIYCRPEKDEGKYHLDKVRNGVVIHQANLYVNVIFLLELTFVLTFIFGFAYFIASFR